MLPDRRDFMGGLLAAAAIPALAPVVHAAVELADQRSGALPALEPDAEAYDFWNGFLSNQSTPLAKVPAERMRGATPIDREAFFFHNGPRGLQPAVDIAPSDLINDGDVNVSINVSAFKPSGVDVQTFERLQNLQLRLDFIQNISIVDLVDTMAWTAIAFLQPDRRAKLPPIQNLTFDPATAWQKMQNIVLPRGQGRWAMNLYGQKRDSFVTQLLRVLTKEVGRFGAVLGLPGVTTTALQSINQFYGAFHSKPESIFRSNPVSVFATASALKQAATSRGIPLRSGTYVLVPVSHATELTDAKLQRFEMRQGLIVPKDTPSVDVHDVAVKALPTVTYATIDVTVKPVQLPCKA